MTLKCLEDLTEETPILNEEGDIVDIKTTVIKKDAVTRMNIEPEQLNAWKQHTNDKGVVYRDRCIANISGFGNVIVKHSYKELYDMKRKANQNFIVHGFNRK